MNYSRKLKEDYVNTLARLLKMKKKALDKEIHTRYANCTLNDWIIKKVFFKDKLSDGILGTKPFYHYCASDQDWLHFYCQGKPSIPKNIDDLELLGDNGAVVDFDYKGEEYFALVTRSEGIYYDEGKESTHAVCLYTKREDILQYNKERYASGIRMFAPFASCFMIIVNTADNTHTVTCPANSVYIQDHFPLQPVEVTSDESDDSFSYDVIPYVEGVNYYDMYDLPNPVYILSCVCHALRCYDKRHSIHRKNSKVGESYRTCPVHVAHPDADNYTYVPMVKYAKEYEPSIRGEYKGGHHKSPVPHERTDHYRICKIAGDYIRNADGTYTYVGERKGTHCHVSGSNVKPRQNGEGVTIYKV